MEKRALRTDRQLRRWVLAMALGAGLLLAHAVSMVFASLAYAQEARNAASVPAPPPKPERELAMKITAPFTLAAVGDFFEHQSTMQLAEPGLQNLTKLLRDADLSFANMEEPIIDGGMGGYRLRKEAVIADLKAMGIRMLNLANNHSMDNGVAGLLSTSALLDGAGIIHAGAGMDLQEARASRFLSMPKGIVGLVGMISISDRAPAQALARNSGASYSTANTGGAPGVNGLHLRTYNIVTADQLQALRKIRDSVYARRNEVPFPDPVDPMKGNDPAERLELFGTWYKVGPTPGNLSYTMDPADLREILRSIRNGKMSADFMIATIHCHQNSFAFQEYSLDNSVPDFLVDLAHQAIDNGADVFIAHGVHTLRGVEIYKGKPIFYGVSSFTQEPAAPTEGRDRSSITNTTAAVDDAAARDDPKLEALLATSRYEGGRLVEVRLNPVDTGQGRSRSLSRMGIPMTPSPEIARRMLAKMQTLSKRFGTTISIEGNVGVIRVPPE